ncbi:MAG: Crp/Fnr family transcriptional regulator [Bacteroidia bacterium]
MQLNINKYLFKGTSFLDLLTPREKKQVLGAVVRKEYKKGQVLFKEGFYSKGVYILRKGKVKLYQVEKTGKSNVVYIYRKGDYFGYRPLLCDEPHPASASAIDGVVVLFLPQLVFLSLLKSSNTLARQLLVNLSHEFTVWINKLTLFTQYSVKERVALTLLILSADGVEQGNKKPVISVNREDLAGFAATTKETLVRMLRVMKDDKIITTKGTKILVLKREELVKMVDVL